MTASALAVTVAGIDFQNPVLLAAGTAAYGRELSSVIDLDCARRTHHQGGERRAASRRAARRGSRSSKAE